MIQLVKKIICLFAVLVFVFSFSVSAKEEFLVYGKDNINSICEALDMEEQDVKQYCEENNITYLAVNPDNTKLIKRVETVDEFSERIVDLSVLSDENIRTLSYELSRFSEANGQIVKLDGFKLLKYELKTDDDKYYLTTYITVKDSKRITLSFYTDVGNERDYIDEIVTEQFKADIDYKPLIIIGVIAFALVGAFVLALIIRDLRRKEE